MKTNEPKGKTRRKIVRSKTGIAPNKSQPAGSQAANRFAVLDEDSDSSSSYSKTTKDKANSTNRVLSKQNNNVIESNDFQTKEPMESSQNLKELAEAKIPPIVFYNKDKWLQMSAILRNHNIVIIKAQATNYGIRTHPHSSYDYRKTIKILDK